jgi:hypothetical protein
MPLISDEMAEGQQKRFWLPGGPWQDKLIQ